MNKLIHWIKDVIGKGISDGISGCIKYLIMLLLPSLGILLIAVLSVGMQQQITMPIYIFIFLALFALIGVIIPASKIISLIKYFIDQKSKFSLNNYSSYKRDEVRGIVCEWDIIEDKRPDKNISFFCPKCSSRLIQRQEDNYMVGTTTVDFYCESCKRILLTVDGDLDQSRDILRNEIERNIRTGEWKNHIKK